MMRHPLFIRFNILKQLNDIPAMLIFLYSYSIKEPGTFFEFDGCLQEKNFAQGLEKLEKKI